MATFLAQMRRILPFFIPESLGKTNSIAHFDVYGLIRKQNMMLRMHDAAGGVVNSIHQSNVHLRIMVQDERIMRIRDECHSTAFFGLAQSRHTLKPQ
jgi:hypothetical protein